MIKVTSIEGLEILDSRGRPTVKAFIALSNGLKASASVPSGASTGAAEAHELRDGDMDRFAGLGCQSAALNISGEIAGALCGEQIVDQETWDQILVELDGSESKSRLGANAILACSLAYARLIADLNEKPLYRHFLDSSASIEPKMPRLTVNLFSGGKHAGAQVPFQDLLLVPLKATSLHQSLAILFDVYQCAASAMRAKYGMRLLTADEGGLAPPFGSLDDIFEDALSAIEGAGYRPGEDIALAVDVAASHFYQDGHYHLGAEKLDGKGLVDFLKLLQNQYPIVSLEDGLAEEDWDHWRELTRSLGAKCSIMGDDLLCTQVNRIQHAVDREAANALLLKVNQVGTISEAKKSYNLARGAGWHITASARSGETEDHWLADLAVGWGSDDIKIGSVTQSERLAKYNRLLEIERELGSS